MARTTNTAEERMNPYAASSVKADSTSDGSSFRLSFAFIFAIVLSGGLLLAVLFTQSRFETIFTDFDIALPLPTIFALSPAMLVMASALFLATVAKEFIGIRPRLVRLCNGLACLASLILGLAYAIALFRPLLTLIVTLS